MCWNSFYNVGTSYTAILARGACGGFVCGYMTFMSIEGFPSFIEEMKVPHNLTIFFITKIICRPLYDVNV